MKTCEVLDLTKNGKVFVCSLSLGVFSAVEVQFGKSKSFK